MQLLGLTITRTRKQTPRASTPSNSWVWGSGSWWPVIREPFTGAWQRNQELRCENVLTYSAVYACVTLIASDIAKIGICLKQETPSGVLDDVEQSPFLPVLRKPNRYQTRIKFIEQWIISKLLYGNSYILKERDARGIVTDLYVLDANVVKPLVAPDGAIYYQLGLDNLVGITSQDIPVPVTDSARTKAQNIIVPASEIIHDTMVPLYHPLCGISPLSACGLAAVQGLSIQANSTRFFSTGSHPGGVLTAPGMISDDVARRLKDHWDNNYTGANAGKVAVLGDGLKFEKMSVNAVDAQLIDQLKWTAEQVCTAFHVPPYMIGIGPMPTYNNIEALIQQYYGQCLQILIESIEALLDEGLSLPTDYETEFELDDLLRMDTPTKIRALAEGIKGGIYAPNEGRYKFDLPPVDGGDEVYLQQQNYSLSALAKRDAQADPFGSSAPAPAPMPPNSPPDQAGQANARSLATELFRRSKQIRFAQHVT